MVKPVRRIRTEEDLQKFLKSRQFAELWTFVLRLNTSVLNKRLGSASESTASAPIRILLGILDECYEWAEEIEAEESPARFGNKAFRTWHARLVKHSKQFITRIIEQTIEEEKKREEISEEVCEYFCKSFGDETRIDYGSGHEAMFLVVLYCLCKIGLFGNEKGKDDNDTDITALVLLVFKRYLKVTRKLQTKYMLEPAGSHGVWGLDDYSFLPFLWGSNQLISSTRILPLVTNDDSMLQEYRDDYLYLDAIAFIKEMKTGSFFEHSPMLHDISQVRGGWKKINQGMIKMYRGEVWEKRVVIQHFLFGNIFVYEEATGPKAN